MAKALNAKAQPIKDPADKGLTDKAPTNFGLRNQGMDGPSLDIEGGALIVSTSKDLIAMPGLFPLTPIP